MSRWLHWVDGVNPRPNAVHWGSVVETAPDTFAYVRTRSAKDRDGAHILRTEVTPCDRGGNVTQGRPAFTVEDRDAAYARHMQICRTVEAERAAYNARAALDAAEDALRKAADRVDDEQWVKAKDAEAAKARHAEALREAGRTRAALRKAETVLRAARKEAQA